MYCNCIYYIYSAWIRRIKENLVFLILFLHLRRMRMCGCECECTVEWCVLKQNVHLDIRGG